MNAEPADALTDEVVLMTTGPARRAPATVAQWVTAAAIALGFLLRLWILTRPVEVLAARYLADDYFYYLNVADNVAHGHGSTFDGGLTRTNGYQPLFLAVLVPVFWLGAGKSAAIHLGLLILAVAAAVASWTAFRLLAARGCPWGGAFTAGTLSLNLFFVVQTTTGFETALALAVSLLALLAYEKREPAWRIGVLCGLAALARVDAVTLAAPMGIALLANVGWRAFSRFAGAAIAIASPWLLWSTLSFGTPMPDSGVMKVGVRSTETTLYSLKAALRPVTQAVFPPFSEELSRLDPPVAVWVLTAAILLLALRAIPRWRVATCWALLLTAAYVLLASGLEEGTFERYLCPAWFVLLLLLSSQKLLQQRAVVALMLLWHLHDVRLYVQWAERTVPADSFVGFGQRRGADVLRANVGVYDQVAAFDAGGLAYFSGLAIVNLDGYMNHDIPVLQRTCVGPYEACLLSYMHSKGITLVAGNGRRLSDTLPQWVHWERVYESHVLADGYSFVLLRVPAPHSTGNAPTVTTPQSLASSGRSS